MLNGETEKKKISGSTCASSLTPQSWTHNRDNLVEKKDMKTNS